jgi:dinuclear metal center YbgI/SA1388 family protein
MPVKLESLLQYTDRYLGIPHHPDYGTALNGLQVQGSRDVRHVVAAVDASEAVIREAAAMGADLLLVHHGMFWDGLKPLTGRRYRKVKTIMDHGMALYSAHLPLDGHGEVGNAALLARALGLEELTPFGEYQGAGIGWAGTLPRRTAREDLQRALAGILGGAVHLIAGGPEEVEAVGVVTGGGASLTEQAAEAGLHALVTGEGSHHTHIDAMELGVNVYFGGHYATETFGVKALAAHLAERFDLKWTFLDHPTDL